MPRNRRTGLIPAVAELTALLLWVWPSSAATVSPSESGGRTVTVWTHEYLDSQEFAVLERAATIFNRSQHTYRVELSTPLYSRYERWVRSAAITGTLPCLLEFDGPFLHEFVWLGYLQPLDRFVSPELLGDILPSILAQGTHDGHLYSLGQYESALALWGNQRDLRAAGVRVPTLEAPWTLAEFEQALRKLSALPGVDHAIDMGAYAASDEFYTYAYAPILQGFGGDLIDRSAGRAGAVLDGPQSIRAMQHLQYWFQQGWARADPNRGKTFPTGAALAWAGNWMYTDYHKALGKDLVVLPLPDFGHGIKTGTGAWNWAISSTCRNPEGAWLFLRFLLSPEEVLRMTRSNGIMPATRSALARSELYGSNGPLRMLVRQIEAGMGVPRPATPEYETIINAFASAAVGIITGSHVESELSGAATRIDGEFVRRHGYPHQ